MSGRIGVVTVLYNSEDVVGDFLGSVARQAGVSLRLYVIDNSESRSGFERCQSEVTRLGIDAVLTFNGKNVGFAAGCNQGIQQALHDGCAFVLLANNDTVFEAGTLHALLQPLLAGETVSCPKILYPGPERHIWFAGGRIDAWTMRTPHIGMMERDQGQHDAEGYTPFATGCFVLLQADVFSRVGFFDERYFVYYEDADFSWRLGRTGVLIRYVPGSVVVHKVSSLTGGKHSTFTQYHSNRNRVLFIRKNLRGLQRIVALTYVFAGRLAYFAFLPRPLAISLWAGLRDGMRVALNDDARAAAAAGSV